MENNERDRKLDQWLDEALSQYSAAEPRIGLEQRVLAHVRAEQEARAGRRNWWRWMPAFAAIAAVLIVAVAVRPYLDKQRAPKHSETEAAITASGESRDKLSVEAEPKTVPDKQVVAAATTPSRAKGGTPRPELTTAANDRADPKEAATAKDSHRDFAEKANLYKAPADEAVIGRNAGVEVGVAGGVAGGVVGGVVSNAPVISAAPAAAPPPSAKRAASGGQAQVLQPETEATTVESQRMIATEKVAEWPKASKKVDALAAKMKSQPKSELQDGTINIMGVNVRLNSTVSTTQQFPTPTPLSKQEKLALAMSHQNSDKASNEAIAAGNDEQLRPVEIKKIEIAPLPGPEKEK